MGTEEEFRAFVAARQGALLRVGFLLTGDGGAAEDLVQSALAKTYLRWGRLRAPAAADAYTRTVLVRLAMRSRGRRWVGEVPTQQLPERSTGDVFAAVDQADAVSSALARLPREQRAVLVLRYYLQFREVEIADVLGCSVGTVKSRASRALAALRADGVLHDLSEVRDVER